MDKTRIPDLNRLERDLAKEKRPGVREIITTAQHKIKDQLKDDWLKDARSELTKEASKNPENMKQIHEDIKKHEKMGIGKISFHFDLSGIEGFKND